MGGAQPRTFKSFNCIARQVSFKSPRGRELHKELERSRASDDSRLAGPNDNIIKPIEEKPLQDESDDTVSEDPTSSSDDGSSDSVDFMNPDDANEDAMFKKLEEAQDA